MNKTKLFILILFLSLFCIKSTYADTDAIQAVLDKVGDSNPENQKRLTELKALATKTQTLGTQLKSSAEEAYGKAQGAYGKAKSAYEKSQELISKATETSETIKSGNVPTDLSLSEFQSLSFISNGDLSKTDEEKAKATTDLFLKKPEKDDIEFQRQKEEAVNQRNANQSADQYSESLVLRQEIADEKDENKTPETIEEAQEALKSVSKRSFRRNNNIIRMKAMQLDYESTNAMMGLNRVEDEKNND